MALDSENKAENTRLDEVMANYFKRYWEELPDQEKADYIDETASTWPL